MVSLIIRGYIPLHHIAHDILIRSARSAKQATSSIGMSLHSSLASIAPIKAPIKVNQDTEAEVDRNHCDDEVFP